MRCISVHCLGRRGVKIELLIETRLPNFGPKNVRLPSMGARLELFMLLIGKPELL